MTRGRPSYGDINEYIAGLSAEERTELAAADLALDIAYLVHLARTERGLTQEEAAARAGLHQQAVSRLERPEANVTLDSLRKYLGALGYTVDIGLRDLQTGKVVGQITLPTQRQTA